MVSEYANGSHRWALTVVFLTWALGSFALIAPLERMTTLMMDGPYDVFGDGAVVILPAPGHTPGHRILKLRLARGGTVLLTGDLWHMGESRARRLVSRFNSDRAQTLVSMEEVEALARAERARIIRQHVEEDFTALPAFPAALD